MQPTQKSSAPAHGPLIETIDFNQNVDVPDLRKYFLLSGHELIIVSKVTGTDVKVTENIYFKNALEVEAI